MHAAALAELQQQLLAANEAVAAGQEQVQQKAAAIAELEQKVQDAVNKSTDLESALGRLLDRAIHDWQHLS